MKFKLHVPSKEAFMTGLMMEVGAVVVKEMYDIYKDIDPLKDVRQKMKAKRRKKEFDHIMAQTNLKGDLA